MAENDLKVIVKAKAIALKLDAVEVVRCKDCCFAEPYMRIDGKTGYYCQNSNHTFQYGTNWERLYKPVKEADDFCSYGERRENEYESCADKPSAEVV